MPRVPLFGPAPERGPALDPARFLAVPERFDVEPNAMSTHDAIQSVAADFRSNAARNGVQLTHSQAVDRVRSARLRGERDRANGNR